MAHHLPPLPPILTPPAPQTSQVRWRPRTWLRNGMPGTAEDEAFDEAAKALAVEAADDPPARKKPSARPEAKAAPHARATPSAGVLTDETLRVLLAVQEGALGSIA